MLSSVVAGCLRPGVNCCRLMPAQCPARALLVAPRTRRSAETGPQLQLLRASKPSRSFVYRQILRGYRDGRPRFTWIGNMHGDEPSGRQLLAALADDICTRHRAGGDAELEASLAAVQLVLVPTLNPDGFAAKTRNTGCAARKSNYIVFPVSLCACQPAGRSALVAARIGAKAVRLAAALAWRLPSAYACWHP